MNFKNKNVIVTGASKGIGLAIADSFVKQGANVYGISRTKPNFDAGINFTGMNINNLEGIREWINTEFIDKPIDILVNGAAVYPEGLLEDTSEKNWDEISDTNNRSCLLYTSPSPRD